MHFVSGFLFDMIGIADAHKPLPISLGEFTAAFANGTIGDPDLGNEEKNPDAPEIYREIKSKYNGICKIFARQWADIHLTEEEQTYSMIHDVHGEDLKYWVVAPGGKSDCTCKVWDWRRFQQVVDHFDGLLKFVVIGRSDHIVEKLKNVIDLTDKFNSDLRGLIPLIYHAEGCVSGVTFLMHLAAAVPPRGGYGRKPCVSIYGGRENTTFTAYCNHQILHTNGAFSCCRAGGCWQSRVIPLPKKVDGNKRLCHYPVKVDGRTIPACMDAITTQDMIRAIEKYYDGNIYSYMKVKKRVVAKKVVPKKVGVRTGKKKKEINILASLSSKGGGEQSALKIAEVLRDDNWKVHFYPWGPVHQNYAEEDVEKYSFKDGILEHMKENLPLLFYANDQIGPFVDRAQGIVELSSDVIIGINYINSSLPKCRWLDKTEKLRGVIFQNDERKDNFIEQQIGFDDTKLITLFGAIDIDSFYEICTQKRTDKNEPFRVLRTGIPDHRKYVTEATKRGGDKKHLWQDKFDKETSVRFYQRLLKDLPKNVIFEFMEAHSELANAYPDEPRMIFRKFDSMSVPEFLSRGHCYLMRSSNHWRDNYPRCHAEAMLSGLISVVEPRNGTAQRIKDNVGDIGLFAVHYDEFLLHLRTLNRKMDYCYAAGNAAKQWAKKNLDPKIWAEVIEDLLEII